MTTLLNAPSRCSTEQSIVEDFALTLENLVRACEKQGVKSVEWVRARKLLAQFGYIE